MPNAPRKSTKPTAAPKAPVPPKATGPDRNTILLAALALANEGTAEVPFSAYGEVMARLADVEGIDVTTGPGGLEVSVRWKDVEEDDATDDVEAVQEVTKSAYTPAGPAKVGPAVDRPSLGRPEESGAGRVGLTSEAFNALAGK
jgi:hypothetical protein